MVHKTESLALFASVLALLAGVTWYFGSPYYALAQFDRSKDDLQGIKELYDRKDLRKGFERQTGPEFGALPPPLTADSILDALVAPEAVRLLVIEPYGEWQFAAADGLDPEIKRQMGWDEHDDPSMPRILDTTSSWNIDRQGYSAFIARPADSDGGHSYHFRREGFSWRLHTIDLSEELR